MSFQKSKVTAEERRAFFRHEPATIWLTGLSAAGKSTLAFAVERRLMDLGHACYVLDGDILRQGLSRDLGFSPADRKENIRRVAEVAKVLNEAGLFVVSAFISPYRQDREAARQIIGAQRFVETYLSTPLEVCEKRDPKGLYASARAGKIADFTGVSAPYEPPLRPSIEISSSLTPEESVELVLRSLLRRFRD